MLVSIIVRLALVPLCLAGLVPISTTARIRSTCAPAKYVVIDSHTVEIYDPTTHGKSPILRLFDMIPPACANQVRFELEKSKYSARTDVQLRDTRTELSEFIYRRGFWTAALSILKWVPYASTVAGVLGFADCIFDWVNGNSRLTSKVACVAGGVLTAFGIGGILQQAAADALTAANAAANARDLAFTQIFDESGEVFRMQPRRKRDNATADALSTALDIFHQTTVGGLYHSHDNSSVTVLHLAKANSTHPIRVHHHHKAFKTHKVAHVWSSSHQNGTIARFHASAFLPYKSSSTKSKRDCNGGARTQTLGQDDLCIYESINGVPSGDPSTMYYGFDLYGTKSQINEFQDDLGITYDDQNAMIPAIEKMSTDIVNKAAWDTCVCEQVKGNWISTGSMQMSWDNTYNGYSPCWNPNCDNAAMLPGR